MRELKMTSKLNLTPYEIKMKELRKKDHAFLVRHLRIHIEIMRKTLKLLGDDPEKLKDDDFIEKLNWIETEFGNDAEIGAQARIYIPSDEDREERLRKSLEALKMKFMHSSQSCRS